MEVKIDFYLFVQKFKNRLIKILQTKEITLVNFLNI